MKNIIPIIVEEVTDPTQLEEANRRREMFDHNAAWFQNHVTEIYQQYRGKCVVIAGEELFSADTPDEAWRLAEAVYPTDEGSFIQYIPKRRRIYLSAV